MRCHVFKSARRADTYVYLATREGFDAIPDALRATLEPLTFVVEFDLTPERTLAREDAVQVLENLTVRGWHLQMPPVVAGQDEHGD
ncbi:MAG: YcgL domain-containing protein [Lysobacteraceae bacterium]